MPSPSAFAATSALAVVLIAAVWDLRWRRIPNWLASPALGLAIIWHVAQGTWREAGLGLLLATLIYLPLWLVGGRGGGDLKLMAALGAWLGPAAWIQIFVLTGVFGGLWALALIIVKRRVVATFKNIAQILRSLLTGRRPAHRLDSQEALSMPHAAIVALALLAWLAVMRPL